MAESELFGMDLLLGEYCRRIDSRDLEGLSAVFTPNCQVSYGDVHLNGLPALRLFLQRELARFASTRHELVSFERLDSGDAGLRGRSKIEAWHRFVTRTDRPRPDLTIFGHFESNFVPTPTGLRIAKHLGVEDDRKTES